MPTSNTTRPSRAGPQATATPVTCPFCGLACDDLTASEGVVDTRGCAKAAAGFADVGATPPHTVAGKTASLDEAAAAAAQILRAAHQPLVVLAGADLAGTRAALALADRAGAIVDHAASPAFLRNLAVLQAAGWVAGSFSEVANRADLVLVVGDDPGQRYPRFHERLTRNASALYRAAAPEILHLGHDLDGPALLDALAQLRAIFAGHSVAGVSPALRLIAERLRAAQYGVVAWDAGALPEAAGELAVEAICGIVRALNATTRCVGLPLGGDNNAQGAVQAMLWQAGWPARISFADGAPRFDPWRHDARRLLAAGEVDALLWVAAVKDEAPPPSSVPTIAMLGGAMQLATPAAVEMRVGRPGIDHPGAVTRADGLVTLPLRAARPSAAPDAAAVLAAIAGHLAAAAP